MLFQIVICRRVLMLNACEGRFFFCSNLIAAFVDELQYADEVQPLWFEFVNFSTLLEYSATKCV